MQQSGRYFVKMSFLLVSSKCKIRLDMPAGKVKTRSSFLHCTLTGIFLFSSHNPKLKCSHIIISVSILCSINTTKGLWVKK